MAPAQMALPMERRNGASAHRQDADDPPTPELAAAPVVPPSSAVEVEAGLWVRR